MPSSQALEAMLRGGDRRSIGRANEVSRVILKHPHRFRELIACLWHQDPVVRSRAADAAEKVSARKPELLRRYKSQLLGLLAETEQIELRWHLAQMIPRLNLALSERRRAAAALRRYLEDRSSLVRTFALQSLVDLSLDDPTLRAECQQLLEETLRSGSAAMKARSRKLLKNFAV